MARGYTDRATLQSGATGTGNGTPMDVSGMSWLGIQVSGITTATITWEASIDGGVTWSGLLVAPLTTGTGALTATANGVYRVQVVGLALFRARISAYTSGTITVVALASTEA